MVDCLYSQQAHGWLGRLGEDGPHLCGAPWTSAWRKWKVSQNSHDHHLQTAWFHCRSRIWDFIWNLNGMSALSRLAFGCAWCKAVRNACTWNILSSGLVLQIAKTEKEAWGRARWWRPQHVWCKSAERAWRVYKGEECGADRVGAVWDGDLVFFAAPWRVQRVQGNLWSGAFCEQDIQLVASRVSEAWWSDMLVNSSIRCAVLLWWLEGRTLEISEGKIWCLVGGVLGARVWPLLCCLQKLFFSEFDLTFFKDKGQMLAHLRKCRLQFPPGEGPHPMSACCSVLPHTLQWFSVETQIMQRSLIQSGVQLLAPCSNLDMADKQVCC